ncbi:DUF3494 domain-containing protein [Psychroserpens burtonensis]|uniref:DUF3494 domain-containing protein n=1 Tax=Psychroserpens burtonensis TaxID=49278 RepID=A0A5C7B9H6_9FLAO|nr:ice-binding family protein [Psychroserpens burtonensis]TXE18104.1 DUF3494 domain-containing protein [Psychroserpens burtonensis]
MKIVLRTNWHYLIEIKTILIKTTLKCFLIPFVLLSSSGLYAQVGIGTTTPDISSVLDVSSNSKGLLMPRLTTLERDGIASPATGLMIYNTTLNDGQLNIGTPSTPSWIGIKGNEDPKIDCVVFGDNISTTSTTNSLVQGMTISPPLGKFEVSFNAQKITNQTFSSSQASIDMAKIYQDLTAISATNTTHSLVFGNGEILFPGVYDLAGAPSIAGSLTLDGAGDTNSVFIIRGSGAFTTGANTIVNLTNGASSNNIFWVSNVALSTGASTELKGSLVSLSGAISLGATTNLEGRMFTKAGAVSIVADCILTKPSDTSYIDLGFLSTFAMWSSAGAITDVATSFITGDVGTALGVLTIAGTHSGTQYPAGTASTNLNTVTTYGLYQNGIEVANSSRAINSLGSVVLLQAMITTLSADEVIEVRWKVNSGESSLSNRTLSYHQ